MSSGLWGSCYLGFADTQASGYVMVDMVYDVTKHITITGSVQGVGFRPFVKRLADDFQLRGYVKNTGSGVTIVACGTAQAIAEFIHFLRHGAPPAARVQRLVEADCVECPEEDGFFIASSQGEGPAGSIPDDRAICQACLAELQEPDNRRFRHLFIHCTQCGPRLSIIQALPYDRERTAMIDFPQCPECQREYLHCYDRRFHAQTNACHSCGPIYWLEDGADGFRMDSQPAVTQAANLLREGRILAIKGTGGFRLCCLAGSARAVAELRRGKSRPAKPFAMMAKDIDTIRKYAQVSDLEAQALQNPANPIVLLGKRHSTWIAEEVAPGQRFWGFMLPSNAFEWLLVDELAAPVVMTSGNASSVPQETSNIRAKRFLAPLTDGIVLHNRHIVQRVDDSVVRAEPDYLVLRRSRGMCSQPIAVPQGVVGSTPLLAMGADLKNVFSLLSGGKVISSSHVGDLHGVDTLMSYRTLIQRYLRLCSVTPRMVVVDAHPGYVSSQVGREFANQWQCECKPVYHHHAHAAAVMAEHGLPSDRRILAIVWDGLGMGQYGELWGGEFLLADYRYFTRVACLKPVALPGGDQAARQPWRNLLAHLHAVKMTDWVRNEFGVLPQLAFLGERQTELLRRAIDQKVNSPLASSAGRLFDAVAALLGLAPVVLSYEGEAAVALEQAAWERFHHVERCYPWDVKEVDGLCQVEWGRFWFAILDDVAGRCPVNEIAAVFHHTLIDVMTVLAVRLCAQENVDTVVFSGGVAQNALLRQGLKKRLGGSGITVYLPHHTPANDGGISLGQAIIAASAQ